MPEVTVLNPLPFGPWLKLTTVVTFKYLSLKFSSTADAKSEMHFLKTDFCYHQVLLFEDNYTSHLNIKHQLQLKTYACFHLST